LILKVRVIPVTVPEIYQYSWICYDPGDLVSKALLLNKKRTLKMHTSTSRTPCKAWAGWWARRFFPWDEAVAGDTF